MKTPTIKLFILRLLAFIVDTAIIMILSTILFMIGVPYFHYASINVLGFEVNEYLTRVGAILSWLYFSIFECSPMQATIGKYLFKLRVSNTLYQRANFAQTTLRHFSKIVSLLLFGGGYLMIFLNKNKQCLHDYFSSTIIDLRHSSPSILLENSHAVSQFSVLTEGMVIGIINQKKSFKSMKTRVSGVISLIGAVCGLIFLIYSLIEYGSGLGYWIRHLDEFLLFLAILIVLISTILYIIWTKFGKIDNAETTGRRLELEKIDYEIQLLNKQIELKELKKKLEKFTQQQ